MTLLYIYIYTQHTRKENIFEFLFIKRKLNKIKLENGLEQTTKLLNENMYKKKKLNLINLKSLEDYRLKIYLKVKNFMVSNNT